MQTKVHPSSWRAERHTLCSSKNCAGWNIPISLSKKRSWLVSPDLQIILFHVWLASYSSGPATFHGVYPNSGFNSSKSIFELPEKTRLSPKAAAVATSLGDLPVHRAHWISDEEYEDLSGRSWSHIQDIIDLLCPTVIVSFLTGTFIPVYHKFVLYIYIYIFIRNMRIDRIGKHCGYFGHHRPLERIYSLVMVCTFMY